MDSQQLRSSLIHPKSPRGPTADPQDVIQAEPASPLARQHLYSLLADQQRAIHETAHFKIARSVDLSSNKFETFLSDRLFESKRLPPRHRRAETTFIGNHSVKKPRTAGISPSPAENFPSPAQGIHPDLKKELRHKNLASLQSFLTKSYQSYRSNYLATSDKSTAQPPTSILSSVPRSLDVRASIPAPPARPAETLELPVCSFVNFYSTKPSVLTLGDLDEKLEIRARRYFKVSIDDGLAKEGKQSASTQCSGNSHLGWN
jgi:hypothetical protein